MLSSFLFKEEITLKTGICLGLSVSIVAIQLFWK
jgi:ABC-type nickel/cobalt efflux system permease component RcnA